MLYKAVIALAMVLLPQTEAFTLSAPSGAIAACRAPAASIESECNPLPPFSEEAATALPRRYGHSSDCLRVEARDALTDACPFFRIFPRSGSPRAEEGDACPQCLPAEEEAAV